MLGVGLLAVGGAALIASSPFDDPKTIYEALASRPRRRIPLNGGSITLVYAGDPDHGFRRRVEDWVIQAATAVSVYFGRWPIRNYGLLVVDQPGDRVGHATTYGFAGSATRIFVGRDADKAAFRRDWVLVHEMIHASLPNLPRRALWLQEGSATWLEPIARAQAGALSVDEVWREAVAGMPRGEPFSDEGGLDGTDRWGRLYWGGATFWLLGEIALWEASGGRHSLIDGMRALAASGDGNAVIVTPERMMGMADRACGVSALVPLYDRFSRLPVRTDFGLLFGRLGIRSDGKGGIAIDDGAELAGLARRLTRPLEIARPQHP